MENNTQREVPRGMTIYVCIQDYRMDDGTIAFKKGKEYAFDKHKQTVSEIGKHEMADELEFDLYFQPANQTSTPMEGESAAQIFDNNFDCYADTEELMPNVPAMTKEMFIEVYAASRKDNELKEAVELLRELKECDYCSVIGDEKIDNFLSKHSK